MLFLFIFFIFDPFSLLLIVVAGFLTALFFILRLPKKPAAVASYPKILRARFNQRSDTPFSELQPNPVRNYPLCDCLDAQYEPPEGKLDAEGNPVTKLEWHELSFHTEVQDTNSDAWLSLESYIAKVRDDGSDELNPLSGIGAEKWEQIVTLPKSIATLKSVKYLSLYGSHLVRIPPEIGGMTALEEFDPYTSWCLHWLPYEITRCLLLKKSRVSTRCLYGNYKYRPPFPKLPQSLDAFSPPTCSVCNGPFVQGQIWQVWISLKVATDVLPLLVHACSEQCIKNLPTPAQGYIQSPHIGGLDLIQPESFYKTLRR